jgi:hypothetical protein
MTCVQGVRMTRVMWGEERRVSECDWHIHAMPGYVRNGREELRTASRDGERSSPMHLDHEREGGWYREHSTGVLALVR